VVFRGKISFVVAAACLLAPATPRDAAAAGATSITIDGRFSPATTLVPTNGVYSIGANLGKQVGGNLFQSFGQFGLSTGQTAAFSGPKTISNVIGGVTGGSPSSIDGKIQSTIAGANLYLINPSGIVFGPHATVNVSGSFHASTADYLKLADGKRFQVTSANGTLSAAPPAAFGFLTARPAAITVNGSTLGPVPGTIGLVGGPVAITGGTIKAPAGTIQVASVAGAGEVPVDPRNTPALTVTSFGPVGLTAGSTLDVSNKSNPGPGGSVFIRSGALTIDASQINADNYGSGAGGQLVLRGDSEVALSDGASVHALAQGSGSGAEVAISTAPAGVVTAGNSTVETGSLGSGNGGALSVETGQLVLTKGAGLESLAQGGGNGGDIAITAGSLLLDIDAPVDPSTGLFSPKGIVSDTSGIGRGGSINIVAGQLALHNGAAVLAQSLGAGVGGGVTVSVGGALTVDSGASLGTLAYAAGSAGAVSVRARSITIDMSVDAAASILDGIGSQQFDAGTGNAGNVAVTADALTIGQSGEIQSATFGAGNSGGVTIDVFGMLSVNGTGASSPTGIFGDTDGPGNAGTVVVSAGSIALIDTGAISSATFGGNGGSVSVTVAGELTIDGAPGVFTGITSAAGVGSTGNAGPVGVDAGGISLAHYGSITSDTFGSGSGGQVSVAAGALSIATSGEIASGTFGPGKQGGSVAVTVDGQLTIDGAGSDPTALTGISATSEGRGDAGTVVVTAGTLSIADIGLISSSVAEVPEYGPASGNGGSVSVTVTGQLTIDGAGSNPNVLPTGIAANSYSGATGNAGDVSVAAGALSIVNGGAISSALRPDNNNPASSGNAGLVTVDVAGLLSMSGSGSRIGTETIQGSIGHAGSVAVTAPQIALTDDAEITSATFGSGAGGSVVVDAAGTLSIDGSSMISAMAGPGSTGNAGTVVVTAPQIALTNGGEITSATSGSGAGGKLVVDTPGTLTIDGLSSISANTESTGNAGALAVNAGGLSLTSMGEISSSTSGSGAGGLVAVDVPGLLSIDGAGSGILAIAASGSAGNAGDVSVSAGTLSIADGGEIAANTFGPGRGGDVSVDVVGNATLDAGGIDANAEAGSTGNAGNLNVSAGALSIADNGFVSTATFASGNGGDIGLSVDGPLSIDGGGFVSSSTLASGNGGDVSIAVAGPLSVTNGGLVASSTAGSGNGGNIGVTAADAATLSGIGPGGSPSGISASALSGSTGHAGTVGLSAASVTVASGAEIDSTTAGTGAGGSVTVSTPGALVLDGMGVGGTQIAASATGPQSGPGGDVTVAANSLLVQGGAQIASSTAGPGKGGNVVVSVAGDVTLTGPGPQITAQSTGSGDAGSITLSAVQLLINNGAGISTEARTSTANGGNITLSVGDFLYLVNGEVTTSVKGQTGNGGNIAIDPQIAVLDSSDIIAQAIAGHGGNIGIAAGAYIASADSIVSATSQLGVSGTVAIDGPLVDLNGTLVVLSSQLRSAVALTRDSCAARGSRPQSSLVEAGRGGLPQDPDATLPALYLAGRDLHSDPHAAADSAPTTIGSTGTQGALHTTLRLTMLCGAR
jgi:filamentous hemagglutinin family protein